eukprot:ctg_868.g432
MNPLPGNPKHAASPAAAAGGSASLRQDRKTDEVAQTGNYPEQMGSERENSRAALVKRRVFRYAVERDVEHSTHASLSRVLVMCGRSAHGHVAGVSAAARRVDTSCSALHTPRSLGPHRSAGRFPDCLLVTGRRQIRGRHLRLSSGRPTDRTSHRRWRNAAPHPFRPALRPWAPPWKAPPTPNMNASLAHRRLSPVCAAHARSTEFTDGAPTTRYVDTHVSRLAPRAHLPAHVPQYPGGPGGCSGIIGAALPRGCGALEVVAPPPAPPPLP